MSDWIELGLLDWFMTNVRTRSDAWWRLHFALTYEGYPEGSPVAWGWL